MSEYATKAADYRAKAASEALAGAAASLGHVRAKHDRAAQVWTDLAAAEDVREVQRRRRQGMANERLLTAAPSA